MKLSLLYTCTLSFPIIIAAAAGKDGRILTGKPHSTVQVLEQNTFETALSDPANGLWLLKFYAPWSGHCKHMAPTLDKIAPYLSGKLAIGKIDCTTQEPLCKEHGIRRYPTLKVYRDGDFFEYHGRRDADSMIEIAEKMSKPAVTMVNSAGEVLNMIQGDGDDSNEVVFVAYDAKGKEIKSLGQELTLVEKILASSTPLQIFGQVARQLQAESSTFVLLNPTISKHELTELNIKGRKSFIAKLEDGMDPVIYDGGWESPEILKFVAKEHKLPIIVGLNSHNFRSIGHMGKPLGPLEKFHALFVRYMPFSLLFPIWVFANIFFLTSKSIKKKAKSKSLKED